MEALFGIPMNTIMLVLLALFGVALASVALIFFRSGVMFRMGLRNIPVEAPRAASSSSASCWRL